MGRGWAKALDDKATPYEMWYNKKAAVKHLKIFGSTAIALNKKHHHKFRAKAYRLFDKAYRLFDKHTRKVVLGRDVYFIEEINDKDVVQIPITNGGEINLSDYKEHDHKSDDNDDQSMKSDDEFESAEEDKDW